MYGGPVFRAFISVCVGIIYICIGIGFMGLAAFSIYKMYLVADSGVRIQAEVTHREDHSIHQTVDFVPTGTTHEYYLSFHYTVAGKDYSQPRYEVSKETWDEAGTNRMLSIKYETDAPGICQIDLPTEAAWKFIFPVVGAVVGFLFFFGGLSKWQARAPSRPATRAPQSKWERIAQGTQRKVR